MTTIHLFLKVMTHRTGSRDFSCSSAGIRAGAGITSLSVTELKIFILKRVLEGFWRVFGGFRRVLEGFEGF